MVEIEQQIHSFTHDGLAVIVYTIRNARGAEVEVTNLGATVVAPDVPAPFPDFSSHVWESRVETDWVVMTLDAEGQHAEAGFYLNDNNELEITVVSVDNDSDAEPVVRNIRHDIRTSGK